MCILKFYGRWVTTILMLFLRWIQLFERKFRNAIGRSWMSQLLLITSMSCGVKWVQLIGLDLLSSFVFCFLKFLMIFCFIAQIHREFRKPLIVMAPKNLLRLKDCKSNLSEFDDVRGHPGFDKQGTRFKRLIKDQNYHSDHEEGIRRLVLCSGKVVLLTAVFYLFIVDLFPFFFQYIQTNI